MASVEHRVTRSGDRWRVRWWQQGRQEQQTFAVEAYARQFRSLVDFYGGWPPPSVWDRTHACLVDERPSDKPPFQEYAETTLHNRTRANEGTKKTYRSMLAHHVYPTIGATPVDDIGRGDLAKLVRHLNQQGL